MESVVVVTVIEGIEESLSRDYDLANAVKKRHEAIILNNLPQFNGKNYNNDDGSVLLFDDPVKAVKFAKKIQTEYLNYPKIPVKIAIHRGNVNLGSDSISGEVIDVAKRIANSTNSGSIIVTAKVNEYIDDSTDIDTEFLDIFEWDDDLPDVRMFAVVDEDLVLPSPSEIDAEVKPISAVEKKGKSSVFHILISIGTLIAASAIFAYLNVLATDPVIDDYSIAILPFDNLGNTEESKILSEAISKDILSNLSLLEDLYVISNYSSMQYRDSERSNKDIAKELGVAFLLKGSTHKFGENLRVTAELIDVIADKSIWKRSYNQDYSEIMNIESEISNDVVSALRLKLSFDDMQNVVGIPTGDIEAFENFIKGRDEADQLTVLGNKNSIDLYSKAIRIDTSFAEAYAELANSTINRVKYNNADPKDIEKLASLYLDKAEFLNDQLARIFTVRGYLNNLLNNVDLARGNLERALELSPNDVETRLHLAEYFRKTNQPKKQLLQNKVAYQLDPLNFETANSYVSALILNGEFDEAEKLLVNINELLKEVDPVEMDRQYVKLYLSKKEYDKSILPLIRMSDIDKEYLGSLGFSYAKIGDTAKTREIIDTLKTFRGLEKYRYNIAIVYAGMSNKDSVYRYLDSNGLRSQLLKDTLYHFFEFIKDDKEYKKLLTSSTTEQSD